MIALTWLPLPSLLFLPVREPLTSHMFFALITFAGACVAALVCTPRRVVGGTVAGVNPGKRGGMGER